MIRLSLLLAGASLLGMGQGLYASTGGGAPGVFVLGDETTESSVQVRSVGGARSVEITPNGSRVTVQDNGRTVLFEKNTAGEIRVEIVKDGTKKELKFTDEAALKNSDAALFEIFTGKGFALRVFGEAPAAEHDDDAPSAPDVRGGSERMLEMRGRIDEMRRNLQDIARAMADGDLSDKDMERLSREAKDRLERDMKRLKERDSENAQNRDAQERAEDSESITQDRYLASLDALRRSLLERINALEDASSGETASSLDDLAGKVKDTYADLRDKILDENKKTWGQTLETGRKFFDEYSVQIDGWGKKVSEPAKAGNPYESMRSSQRSLLKRVKSLRGPGGDKYEETLDSYEDKIKDTYADLFDKLDEDGKTSWKSVSDFHTKFSAQMTADLDKLERQISVRNDLARPERDPVEEPETPSSDWKDSESPERDIKLPAGEQADIVAGVRVARLAPLVKKQMDLESGLSVNEIVDPEGLLAIAGVEVYDIILEFNGDKVDTRDGLRKVCKDVKKGGEYSLLVLRDGKKKTLQGKR